MRLEGRSMRAGGISPDSTATGFLEKSTLNQDVLQHVVQIFQTLTALGGVTHQITSDAETTAHAFLPL